MASQFSVVGGLRKTLRARLIVPLFAVATLALFVGIQAQALTPTFPGNGTDKQKLKRALTSFQGVLKNRGTVATAGKDLNWLVSYAQKNKTELNGAFQQALKKSRLTPARKKALQAKVNKVPNGFAGVIQSAARKVLKHASAKTPNAVRSAAVTPAIGLGCIADLIKLAAAINTASSTGNWDPVLAILPSILGDCIL